MNIIILCRVIDNFGDAGFCFRLAKSLLFIDNSLNIDIITDKIDLFIKLAGGTLPFNINLIDWDKGAGDNYFNTLFEVQNNDTQIFNDPFNKRLNKDDKQDYLPCEQKIKGWQPPKTAFTLISENKVIYSYGGLYSQKVDCFGAEAPRNDENEKFLEMPKVAQNNYLRSVIILECFQCTRPDWLSDILFNTVHKIIYIIMIDYLTAEKYAEDFHKLPSLTRKKSVKKVNFMPGFTKSTGGLIFDENTLGYANSKNKNNDFSSDKYPKKNIVATRAQNNNSILFFSYKHNLPPVISALKKYNSKCCNNDLKILLAAGVGKEPFLNAVISKNNSERGANLYKKVSDQKNYIQSLNNMAGFAIETLSYLPQKDWDKLLYSTPTLFIRGEDSLARACLSGNVFLWQAYPQSDHYQMVKVKALLERMKKHFNDEDFLIVERAFLAYNDDSGDSNEKEIEDAVKEFLEKQQQLKNGYIFFAQSLIDNGNFSEHLLEYIHKEIFL